MPQVTRRAPEWNLFLRRLLLALHAELDVVFKGLEDGELAMVQYCNRQPQYTVEYSCMCVPL